MPSSIHRARALGLVALASFLLMPFTAETSAAGEHADTAANASPVHPETAPATDRSRITFTARRASGKADVHVMSADGRGALNVTRDDAVPLGPTWSRDGKLIAYTSGRADGIWFVRPDGKEKRQFIDAGFSPAFSPVENRIAYVTREGLWVARTDGTKKVRLTGPLARVRRDRNPSWSPDGGRIAYYEQVDRKYAIFVVDVATKSVKRLTDATSSNHSPCWSPDGKSMAFVSNRNSNDEVYVMRADGSEPKRLTRNPGIDTRPCWSPDGKRIAFESQRAEAYGIHVMSASGEDVRLVSDAQLKARNPCWAPAAGETVHSAGGTR